MCASTQQSLGQCLVNFVEFILPTRWLPAAAAEKFKREIYSPRLGTQTGQQTTIILKRQHLCPKRLFLATQIWGCRTSNHIWIDVYNHTRVEFICRCKNIIIWWLNNFYIGKHKRGRGQSGHDWSIHQRGQKETFTTGYNYVRFLMMLFGSSVRFIMRGFKRFTRAITHKGGLSRHHFDYSTVCFKSRN